MSGKQFYDCHDWVQQPDGSYVCKTCGVSDLEVPLPPCQLPLLDGEESDEHKDSNSDT